MSNSLNSEAIDWQLRREVSEAVLPPAQDGWNYEATVKRVEEITAQIEAGELELAEVCDQFAAAMAYLRQCEVFLVQRQKQMDILIEPLTDEPEGEGKW